MLAFVKYLIKKINHYVLNLSLCNELATNEI